MINRQKIGFLQDTFLNNGLICQKGIQKLLSSIPDIPQDWIDQTDSQLRDEGATEAMLEEWRRGQEDFDDSELEG